MNFDSFSSIHSNSYATIAIQDLNLNYFYPSIYWNCACLDVESTPTDEKKSKTTDYGSISKAIYKIKSHGTTVNPPSINESEIGFTPMEATNTILYGLGGIPTINMDIYNEIKNEATTPFVSFMDFYERLCLKENTLLKPQNMVNLIKAGCFDELPSGVSDEKFNRTPNKRFNIAMLYINLINPPKTELTISNFNKCIEYGIKGLNPQGVEALNIKKNIISTNNFYCQDPNFKSKKHYIVPLENEEYVYSLIETEDLTEDKDYYYSDNRLIIVDKSLEKALKTPLNLLKESLHSDKVLAQYNRVILQNSFIQRFKSTNVHRWEFESTAFYHSDTNEFTGVDLEQYGISNFNDLPEEPKFVTRSSGNREWKQYEVNKICGTIVDKNDTKHIITLLTSDNQIVNIKLRREQYAYYKKVITQDVNGESVTVDDNWFTRGNLLIVTGYRNGEDTFRLKRYKNTVYQHTISRIAQVKNGELFIQSTKFGEEE